MVTGDHFHVRSSQAFGHLRFLHLTRILCCTLSSVPLSVCENTQLALGIGFRRTNNVKSRIGRPQSLFPSKIVVLRCLLIRRATIEHRVTRTDLVRSICARHGRNPLWCSIWAAQLCLRRLSCAPSLPASPVTTSHLGKFLASQLLERSDTWHRNHRTNVSFKPSKNSTMRSAVNMDSVIVEQDSPSTIDTTRPLLLEIRDPLLEQTSHMTYHPAKIITDVNIKLIPKQYIRIKLRILRI